MINQHQVADWCLFFCHSESRWGEGEERRVLGTCLPGKDDQGTWPQQGKGRQSGQDAEGTGFPPPFPQKRWKDPSTSGPDTGILERLCGRQEEAGGW